MSRKSTNYINMATTLELLRSGYSFQVRELNVYQLRIRYEESDNVYDWYHTTGTLVVKEGHYFTNIGRIYDPEEIGIAIKNHIKKSNDRNYSQSKNTKR